MPRPDYRIPSRRERELFKQVRDLRERLDSLSRDPSATLEISRLEGIVAERDSAIAALESELESERARTARLRGEYRARKVSLEVEAQMQSVRHWTTYTSVNEKPSEPDSDSGLNLGRRVIGLYDFKVPVTVDLAARFNWFLSRKVTLFAEGRNLCDAKLYDWAYYRDYGVGFTAGVKLQF